MYKVLNCTPETVTEKAIEDLQIYEEAGSYPPRFKLLFYTQHREVSCQPVTISLDGLANGGFLFNTMLGERFGNYNNIIILIENIHWCTYTQVSSVNIWRLCT